jgi:hypothetical protein
MAIDPTCPNPLLSSDAAALIGLLAVLEEAIWTDMLPGDFAEKVQARFARAGLLRAQAEDRDLRQAVADLNQRLRYVLGEYDEAPQPISGPD